MGIFAFTEDGRWRPGIGDPTVVGWVTVVAYFTAAYFCYRASRNGVRAGAAGTGQRLFWSLFGLVLAFLGINKQLDLQTWFTLFFKHLALNEGWYSERRALQAGFIAAVALGGLTSLAAMRHLAGSATRPIVLALFGGILLGCFVLIRASSFHHVDRMLGMNLGGLRINWILELGSISIVAAGAALGARAPSKADVPSRVGAANEVKVDLPNPTPIFGVAVESVIDVPLDKVRSGQPGHQQQEH